MPIIGFHCIGLGWNFSPSVKVLCTLENVTKASTDVVLSDKWLKFEFGADYPFQLAQSECQL